MRRMISLTLLVALLLLSLCGCGRAGEEAQTAAARPAESTEKPVSTARPAESTEKPVSTASPDATAEELVMEDDPEETPDQLLPPPEPLTDPFPEEAYRAYQAGTPVPEADWERVVEEHEKTGVIYHYVLDYTPGKAGPLETLAVYRYDRLPSFDNREQRYDAYFRDGWCLSMSYRMDNGGVGSEIYSVPIDDPGVFGAVERELLPLSFAPGADLNTGLPDVEFYVTEPGRGDTIYQILRDGRVIRNRGETSTTRLSDEVTALFFAFRNVYLWPYLHSYPYYFGDKTTDFPKTVDPAKGAMRVEIRRGDEARELSVEEGKAFLDLVSDPGAEDHRGHTFLCRFRSNCGPEEHGDLLLHFSVYRRMREEDEIYDYDKREFDLYADGHIVVFYNYKSYFPLVPTKLDTLIVDRYTVSETAFDLEAILALLED